MTELFLYALVGLLLLAASIKLLLPARTEASSGNAEPADFFPVHCRYFPQMRHVFSREDAAFLKARSSRALLRRWKTERRKSARLYLSSLQRDFAGLSRLARTLARHSEHLEARQQGKVVAQNLHFQLLYMAAGVQIMAGLPAGTELQRMARLLGSISGRLDKAALTLDSTSGALTP